MRLFNYYNGNTDLRPATSAQMADGLPGNGQRTDYVLRNDRSRAPKGATKERAPLAVLGGHAQDVAVLCPASARVARAWACSPETVRARGRVHPRNSYRVWLAEAPS